MESSPRIVIPVCEKHGRFQTSHGRWLNSSEDLENHIIYTHSQDAILSDGECDICFQERETVNIDSHPTPYCSVHNRHQTNEGRWVETILYSHLSEPMETPCDECDDPAQIQIVYEKIAGLVIGIIYLILS